MTAVEGTSPRSGRTRPPFVAIVGYALRSCLPRRRWAGALVPCAAAVAFGVIARGLDGTPAEDFAQVALLALFALILPVTCLVVGDAVLGAELRSGTLAFTWLSPVPRWQIAVGRWVAGSLVASGCMAVSFAGAALAAGVPASAGPVAVAGAFGALAYVAVFIAIGCIAQRAAVWSLAFVFLVERLLGAALSGIAQLSPAWVARSAFIDLSSGPAHLVREGIPQGSAALVRLCVITVVALVVASMRLGRLTLHGSAD